MEKSKHEKKEENEKPFLTSSVPNLGFDDFFIDIQATSRELDTDRGFRLEAKLVPGESRKQIGLSNTGIAD